MKQSQLTIARAYCIRPILAAALVLALALTFGCSDDKDGGGGNTSGWDVFYGPSVTYEGETYETVVIGTQIWLQRNLNVESSNGNSHCYNDDPAYCEKYGRLYDWATAMDLPSYCNGESCNDQINTPHQGICPPNFHIPSGAEWNTLLNYVGGYLIAGKILKSQNGWTACLPHGGSSGKLNACEGAYGFEALPGGTYRGEGSGFADRGNSGYWWIAREKGDNSAYSIFMFFMNEPAWTNDENKNHLISIRCIQD